MNNNLISSDLPYYKTKISSFDIALSNNSYNYAEIIDGISASVEVSSRDAKVKIKNPLTKFNGGGRINKKKK